MRLSKSNRTVTLGPASRPTAVIKRKQAAEVVKEEDTVERPQMQPRKSLAWMDADVEQETPQAEVTTTATTPIKVVQMS